MKLTTSFLRGRPSAWWGGIFLLALGATGCGGSPPPGPALAIGFIYIGPHDDYGYSQAHAEGAAAVRKLPGVQVFEEERVADTVDVQKTMNSMIAIDGVKVIFPTSFNYYDPHVLKLAREHPGVWFIHCGGLWDEQQHPRNVSSYFGYIDECVYLSGIVAGHTTRSKKLGFVAGKEIPQVLRNVNAFMLGARSVDPSITCRLIVTGEWSLPNKEAEAANVLIDQGVDVLTCHVNSPKVVLEQAERRGIYCCGYHTNQSTLAPKGYLTGAEWNWEKVYTDYVTAIQAGRPVPNLVRGGLKEGVVKTSPYGPAVRAEARQAADAVKAQLLAGTFVIFKGPIKDNKGNVVIPEGTEHRQHDLVLEAMNYQVEGVISR
jgi:simple sugar transport system substrate-binding protein